VAVVAEESGAEQRGERKRGEGEAELGNRLTAVLSPMLV
jgi:hypothetical protein